MLVKENVFHSMTKRDSLGALESQACEQTPTKDPRSEETKNQKPHNHSNPAGIDHGIFSVVSCGPMHVEVKIAPLHTSCLESRDCLCTA